MQSQQLSSCPVRKFLSEAKPECEHKVAPCAVVREMVCEIVGLFGVCDVECEYAMFVG